MNSTLPPSPEPGAPGPSSAPQFGMPAGAPAPAPQKKRGKWFIAGGCGCLAIIALVVASCSAIVMNGSDDGEDTSTTTDSAPAAV